MFFGSQAAFRRWLRAHHDSSRELIVEFFKVSSGMKSLTYRQALDEALAFGWIDGVRKSLGARSYTIRFTPRKKNSSWSAVNTARYRELLKQGRIGAAGCRAFEARDAAKTTARVLERARVALDPAFEAKLRANDRAARFFHEQPPGYRKLTTLWIMSAKHEETRLRRLAVLIEHCAAGRRIDFMKPQRR